MKYLAKIGIIFRLTYIFGRAHQITTKLKKIVKRRQKLSETFSIQQNQFQLPKKDKFNQEHL